MRILGLALSMLAFVSGLSAQTATGSIVGTVLDPAGAAAPGASIVVTNLATNDAARTQTTGEGNYLVPLLRPGTYKIEVNLAGFKKFVQEGIVLQVQQQARLDITLAVGDVTESVSVTADASVLETTSSSIGKVVDNKRILDLPLNTRNVYGLIYLTPGVAGGIGNSHNQLGYSVNGVRGGLFDTLIDGSSAAFPTVNGFHGISVFPSVDAVAEFKVQASNYSAEFGRSNGSVLNLVYKSGTNAFHGSAYEFLRNSVLDANNYFNNSRGVDLASFKRNQFGGTFSGPLRKDRTFFLVAYESLRERSFRETLSTVPTEEQRRGDFSLTRADVARAITIFDPLATTPSGNSVVRSPFPGNIIPSNRFDPVAVNVMRFYPTANQAGLPGSRQQNFYNSGSASIDTNNYDLRIDHNITQAQKIFGRLSRRYSFSGPPQFFPGETGQAEGRINLNDWGTNAVTDYTNTLNATSILNLRLSFARNLFLFDNQGLGFAPSSLGLPSDFDSAVDLPMFPRFGVAGQVNLGGNDHRQSGFNQYGLAGSFTKLLGKHSLKAGYEGRHLRINVWEARAAGTFNFTAGMTQGPNPNQASATAGYGFASFLLGAGANGNFFQNWKNVASTSFYHAFYLQDDFRVTRKLTLNLGVRYDFDTPRKERYDRMSWFDPSAPSPLAQTTPGFSNLQGGLRFVGVDGNNRVQYDGDWNNIAPRLGFAYQLNEKTVIRGGWGQMFSSSTLGAQGTVGPYGFRVETPWVASLDNITPLNYLRNPFPAGFRPVPGSRDGLLTAIGGNVEGPLRETPVPYVIQYNFTIQRELPGRISLEVAYVGNRGRQLSRGGEGGFTLNQVDPRFLSLGSQLNQLVDNPFFGQGLPGILANPRISRAQLLRPYPQFLNVLPLFSAGSNSDYNALQTSFSKRYSKGVVFEGNYTWAKSIDDGTSSIDSYNLRLGRSATSVDFRHRFVFSGVYELPFGRGRQFLNGMSKFADALLGGWQVNGIYTLQSGSLLGIGASNTAGIFNMASRANNNGNSAALDIDAHDRLLRWFDTSVFSQPAAFTLGNVSTLVPDLRGHHTNNMDLSVFKEFRPVERIRIQFRAESFNFANRVQFSNPNTTVTAGAAFGRVTAQANQPRQLQFGLKLLF
ncbi:MAG: carboxypeptidase regulatory-like domain-containing protein [Bryobacter sp.]|nr:carboxypeptidase regulatory-like domain-containing protein [Bryobacter sp.]